MKHGLYVASLVGAVLLPRGVHAQDSTGVSIDTAWAGFRDVHQRDACRLAHQVLTLGQPANKRSWAFAWIGTCGPEGGDALAHQLELHRADLTNTTDLTAIVVAARDLVDGSLFRSALAIAGDDGAGTAARVSAMRIIYGILRPGTRMSYAEFVNGSVAVGAAFSAAPEFGSPLPPDAAVQARAVVQRIYDTTHQADLKNAALNLLVLASSATLTVERP